MCKAARSLVKFYLLPREGCSYCTFSEQPRNSTQVRYSMDSVSNSTNRNFTSILLKTHQMAMCCYYFYSRPMGVSCSIMTAQLQASVQLLDRMNSAGW